VSLAPATRSEITALRDRYPHPRSAILPSLWAVQNEAGYLTVEGMAEVAAILRLAPSEVQAVGTFYSMYFKRPAGDHHVLVCVNVSCALRGADEIVSHVETRLACPSGGTTADGAFTWESTVECLGACGGAPAMQIDHHFHEDLTPERVDGIFERVRAQPREHPASAPAPASGPHPPTAETPPLATAQGPPADTGMTQGRGPVDAEPGVEQTEMPLPSTAPTANPRGSRSRPRRRPRLNADDL
jgi:NADH-quinone oxidoreductase subunit E